MAGREVARGDREADLVVQLARRRDVAVLLNVEPQTGLAQRCGATIRSFGAGDNCNPGISGCAGGVSAALRDGGTGCVVVGFLCGLYKSVEGVVGVF